MNLKIGDCVEVKSFYKGKKKYVGNIVDIWKRVHFGANVYKVTSHIAKKETPEDPYEYYLKKEIINKIETYEYEGRFCMQCGGSFYGWHDCNMWDAGCQ